MHQRLAAMPLVLLILLAVTGAGTLFPDSAKATPTLVVDAETGAVLHADQAGTPWYPASLTKLMTSYITFERLREDETFTMKTSLKVSKLAAREPPSKMGVPVGGTVSVRKALEALIIYSANDIAVALAEGVAGSLPAFIDRMNATASRLGMSATTFRNPHGLPQDEQVTTARDLAILARALLHDFPEYHELFAMDTLQWGKKRLRARNSLLRTFSGADGMKTGYICASGYNLVASATRDGRRLIAVILGAPSGNYRMQMASNLMETAFSRNGAQALDFGTVDTLSNDASLFLSPPNLRPQLCNKNRKAPKIVKAGQLDGWGALFGHFKTRKSAQSVLSNNIAALRGIATTGKAAVTKASAGHAAVLAGLTIDKVLEVCDHLNKGGLPCAALSPAEVNDPPSALY